MKISLGDGKNYFEIKEHKIAKYLQLKFNLTEKGKIWRKIGDALYYFYDYIIAEENSEQFFFIRDFTLKEENKFKKLEQEKKECEHLELIAKQKRAEQELFESKRQFERIEREEQERERLELIAKQKCAEQELFERIEKHRKEQVEKERLEKERVEQEKLDKIKREETRLIQIFNSEDNIPPFTIGYAHIQPHPYYGDRNDSGYYWDYLWVSRAEQKYMLTPSIIKKIQSCDIGELGTIYKKIVGDTNWIKKYAPLEDRNKAYIDFCFDYIINKLDEIIAEQQASLERTKKRITELEELPGARNWQHSQCLDEVIQKEGTLQNLSSLKVLDKSREYYYENDSIFYSIIGKWIAPRPLEGEVTLSNVGCQRYPLEIRTHDCQLIKNGKVECYSHWIHHLFINLNSYLTDFIKTFDSYLPESGLPFDDCNMVGKFIQGGRLWGNIFSEDERKTIQILQSKHCITSYKEYVQHSMVTAVSKCKDTTSIYRTFIKSDFNPLLKLGDSIIELIENLRPDVLLI